MDSLSILKNPYCWTYMICPVESKTRIGDRNLPLVGFVLVGKSTVYVKNMFGLKPGPMEPQLVGVEKHEYKSFEALVADGWITD